MRNKQIKDAKSRKKGALLMKKLVILRYNGSRSWGSIGWSEIRDEIRKKKYRNSTVCSNVKERDTQHALHWKADCCVRQNCSADIRDIRETCPMEAERTEELQLQGIEGRVWRCDGRTGECIGRWSHHLTSSAVLKTFEGQLKRKFCVAQ
jgi:hypothetical protein